LTENWQPFLCNVNDKLASILLNLALASDAPIPEKPWLLWVWVYMNAPRPDGLSDGAEAPTLYKIEDALTPRILERCKGMHVGRITTQGRREFYFYAQTNDGFREAVSAAMAEFREYRFDFGDQEDRLWDQYLKVLYPSEDELQRISNRDVLAALEKNGNVASLPRPVQHWIFFPSDDTRDLFKVAAESAGFEIDSVYEVENKESRFAICVQKIQAVDSPAIDTTVLKLFHLAREHRGEYDGWETQVVTQ